MTGATDGGHRGPCESPHDRGGHCYLHYLLCRLFHHHHHHLQDLHWAEDFDPSEVAAVAEATAAANLGRPPARCDDRGEGLWWW